MNAIEHGNQTDRSFRSGSRSRLRRRAPRPHHRPGRGRPIPEARQPDIEAKLEGLQTPRGWGLFLIQNMVDDLSVTTRRRTPHRRARPSA